MNHIHLNSSIYSKRLPKSFWMEKSKIVKLSPCVKLRSCSSSLGTFTSQQSRTLLTQDRFISKRQQKIRNREVKRRALQRKQACKKVISVLAQVVPQRTPNQRETSPTQSTFQKINLTKKPNQNNKAQKGRSSSERQSTSTRTKPTKSTNHQEALS